MGGVTEPFPIVRSPGLLRKLNDGLEIWFDGLIFEMLH